MTNALFGISILMGLLAFGSVARLFIWNNLVRRDRERGLMVLTAPHAFRAIGLSFMIPGVVSGSLQPAFAVPAAYGDLAAAVLALVALVALHRRWPWRMPLVWLCHLWGTLDLLSALYRGAIGVGIDPSALGAAYFIPTVLVPALLVLHLMAFLLLVRTGSPRLAERGAG